MTDVQRVQPTDDVWQVTVDEIIAENDLLRARVATLETDITWYMAIVKVAIHQLHQHQLRRDRENQAAAERLGLCDEQEQAA